MKINRAESKLPLLLALLFVFVFVLFAYTFFHEGGHAFFGLLFGGTLTRFNVDFITFSAHVGMDGSFTVLQRAVIAVAGVGLPIILWTLLLLLMPGPDDHDFVRFWFMLSGTMMSFSPLIAWIVIPILAASGQTISDDSANFLQITGASPLLVSAAALLVMMGGFVLYFYKMGGIRTWRTRLSQLHKTAALPRSSLTTIRIMAAATILLGAATFGLSRLAGSADPNKAPEGYELAFEAGFASGAVQDAALYEFTLDQPADVRFFFTLDDFNRAPLNVQLHGADGMVFEFLRFEEAGRIGHATVNPPPFQLEPGSYQIRATAQQEKSSLRGFIKYGD
jgi:hypothetical protein